MRSNPPDVNELKSRVGPSVWIATDTMTTPDRSANLGSNLPPEDTAEALFASSHK